MNELQTHVNEEVKKDIDALYDHAKIANEEMGVIKTDIAWIKPIVKKLDDRTWYILSAIILGIMLEIFKVLHSL